jgi:hypothetical protein
MFPGHPPKNEPKKTQRYISNLKTLLQINLTEFDWGAAFLPTECDQPADCRHPAASRCPTSTTSSWPAPLLRLCLH